LYSEVVADTIARWVRGRHRVQWVRDAEKLLPEPVKKKCEAVYVRDDGEEYQCGAPFKKIEGPMTRDYCAKTFTQTNPKFKPYSLYGNVGEPLSAERPAGGTYAGFKEEPQEEPKQESTNLRKGHWEQRRCRRVWVDDGLGMAADCPQQP
jgi:hypothetical protein